MTYMPNANRVVLETKTGMFGYVEEQIFDIGGSGQLAIYDHICSVRSKSGTKEVIRLLAGPNYPELRKKEQQAVAKALQIQQQTGTPIRSMENFSTPSDHHAANDSEALDEALNLIPGSLPGIQPWPEYWHTAMQNRRQAQQYLENE